MTNFTKAEANFLEELKEHDGSSVNWNFGKKYREATLRNLKEKNAIKVAYVRGDIRKICYYFLPEVEIPARINNRKVYTSFEKYMLEVHHVTF